MKAKPFVISDQPLLVGQLLARAAARQTKVEKRHTLVARLFGRRDRIVRRYRLGPVERVWSNLPTPCR